MATPKIQRRRQARKGTPRRPSGSRVGDDLVQAFEEMASHLRGEIELDDVAPPARNQQ
jgi:hypothetical protein